jgi:colicin import membrane protein
MNQPNTDSSVLFSLAELAAIEAERIRDEERAHAEARDAKVRHEALAAQQKREAEMARVAEAQAEREREAQAAAEAAALRDAREHAAREVARIEAEAKARAEADDATRRHEIALLKANSERHGTRLVRVLGGLLGVALFGGGAAAYAGVQKQQGLERRIALLENEKQTLRETSERATAIAARMEKEIETARTAAAELKRQNDADRAELATCQGAAAPRVTTVSQQTASIGAPQGTGKCKPKDPLCVDGKRIGSGRP